MLKMKKWMLFLILGLLMGIVMPLSSQNNRTNPFEVSSRIQNTPKAAEADTTVTDTTRAAVSDNPFEVNHVPLRRQQFKPVQKAIEDISKVSFFFIIPETKTSINSSSFLKFGDNNK